MICSIASDGHNAVISIFERVPGKFSSMAGTFRLKHCEFADFLTDVARHCGPTLACPAVAGSWIDDYGHFIYCVHFIQLDTYVGFYSQSFFVFFEDRPYVVRDEALDLLRRASHKLVHVEDAVDFFPGQFDFRIVGETFSLDLNAYSSSYFYTKSGDLIPTIGSAEVKIVPEPTAIMLLLILLLRALIVLFLLVALKL